MSKFIEKFHQHIHIKLFGIMTPLVRKFVYFLELGIFSSYKSWIQSQRHSSAFTWIVYLYFFLKLIVYLQFILNINTKTTLIQSTNHISSLDLKAGVKPNIPYRCSIFFYNPGQSLRMLFSLITTRKIQLYNLEKDMTMRYYH